jgi:hypothetical protein
MEQMPVNSDESVLVLGAFGPFEFIAQHG